MLARGEGREGVEKERETEEEKAPTAQRGERLGREKEEEEWTKAQREKEKEG